MRIFLLVLVVFLLLPTTVLAHGEGKIPFFKVNGIHPEEYSVPIVSAPEFKIPQDIATTPLLVGEPINFEIDTFVVPPEEFEWDFGDGQKGQGVKNIHTYTKMGSYIVTIYTHDEEHPQPQLLQSTLIHIVPNKEYPIPKAVIQINGKQAKDFLGDIIQVPLSQDVQFNAALSTSSSPIVEYLWDFGDGIISTEPQPQHHYQNSHQYFPAVRIKNADGFIADTFVALENQKATSSFADNFISKLPWVVGGIVLLAAALFLKKG